MTPLRAVNLIAAGVATAAALAFGQPEVFQFMLASGFVLVIVGAGSVAADAFPFRRLAFICSVLTIPAGVIVGFSGFLSIPPLLAAMPALALQVAPVAGKLRT
ncbi:MAG: hypothetical protein QOJ13_488 [Gaiellales bacterium]|jgi:hypothetical protein|nr:hypothetical protein [Gaiellales bacterium]